MILFSSCNDQNEIIDTPNDATATNPATRLYFEDEIQLQSIIEGVETRATHYQKPDGFVSLMSLRSDVRSGDAMTYYEALGYDSLVPNQKFEELLFRFH